MNNKNLVLIGFMASGKTLVGQALADRLARPLVSTDALIEQGQGKSVRRIFEENGEEYFRAVEHEVVKELSQRQGLVIDAGGGVVLNNKNFALLRKNGIMIHLKATPEVIFERVKGLTGRPLLNVPDPLARIRELYFQRLPLYDQADWVVDSSDPSIEVPVVEILRRISV